MTTSENDQNRVQQTSLDLKQEALFKAAKVGNINLMRELIIAGANPFLKDENGFSSITYATNSDSIKTGNLLLDLADILNQLEIE